MALDTSSTWVPALKSQALSYLLTSMVIDFPAMKENLIRISQQSNATFESLLNVYTPAFKKLTSFDINGSMLLAYLDFYTLYITLHANENPVKNLQNLTLNKMAYLLSLFKDTGSIIREKSIQKDNKYAIYTDFMNPKGINLSVSKVYLLKDKLSSALCLSPVLTLPIEKTEDVNVLSIISKDTDSYVNIIENNNIKNDIDYSVDRKGFNKIGVVDVVIPLKTNRQYGAKPKVSGTVHGYFSESISISISDVILDSEDKLSSVSIVGSSDNLRWSSETIVPVNVLTSFLVDNNVDIGLSIMFDPNETPLVGDAWKINIRYISIDNPMLISSIKFMTLKKISYIMYNDLTKSSVDFISHRVKYRQAESYRDLRSKTFNNGINNIIPIFNNINDYELVVQQNSYDPKSYGNELTHSFKFNIVDVHGVYNEYSSYGITSFNGFKTTTESPILGVALDTNDYISNTYLYVVQPKDQTQVSSWALDFSNSDVKIGDKLKWEITDNITTIYNPIGSIIATGSFNMASHLITFTGQITGTASFSSSANNTNSNNALFVVSKQFIEHTLLLTLDKDSIYVPILNKKEKTIHEYFVADVGSDGTATFTTRFPVDPNYSFHVCNISNKEVLQIGNASDYTTTSLPINKEDIPIGNARMQVKILDYDMKAVYSIIYTPKKNSYVEITNYDIASTDAWMFNHRRFTSNIYYMYYTDLNGDNKVALCTRDFTDTLTPYYGSVSSIIEMRSLDQGYVSPMIFEYTLTGN